jgi:hypothetical protein
MAVHNTTVQENTKVVFTSFFIDFGSAFSIFEGIKHVE